MKDIKYIKTQIRDYVKDHYKYYGFYPYDVEVDNTLYSYAVSYTHLRAHET